MSNKATHRQTAHPLPHHALHIDNKLISRWVRISKEILKKRERFAHFGLRFLSEDTWSWKKAADKNKKANAAWVRTPGEGRPEYSEIAAGGRGAGRDKNRGLVHVEVSDWIKRSGWQLGRLALVRRCCRRHATTPLTPRHCRHTIGSGDAGTARRTLLVTVRLTGHMQLPDTPFVPSQ